MVVGCGINFKNIHVAVRRQIDADLALPQGPCSVGDMQLMALANILAVLVFPVPLEPQNR